MRIRDTRNGAILALACLTVLAGCPADESVSGEPRPVECPAVDGSRVPNLAVGLDGLLYLSWVEPHRGGHAFRFATWADDGWSEPRTIATGEDWFVNWADFPSMTALADGTLAAHWLVRSGGAPYAYDVLVSLSGDGGASWTDPLRPHRDGTSTEHGFVSVVPSVEGYFELIWLDGRETAASPAGAMTLRSAILHTDGTLSGEVRVDKRVCDCCSTDAVRMDDGVVLAAYRDRTDSEIRDIAVARREGPVWSRPRPVHLDGWRIAACPVNGPALAVRGERIALAWFTSPKGDAAVQVAFSGDGGRTFREPLRVDHGDPIGRVDVVLLEDGSAVVSWLEKVDDQAKIILRRVRSKGALESKIVATTAAARASGFPRTERLDDQIVLAWTTADDPPRVATAVLPL